MKATPAAAIALAAVIVFAGCGNGTPDDGESAQRALLGEALEEAEPPSRTTPPRTDGNPESSLTDTEIEALSAATALRECGTGRTASTALCLGASVTDNCREAKEAGFYGNRTRRCVRNSAIGVFQVLLDGEGRSFSYIADSVDRLVMPTADRNNDWHRDW